MTFDQLELFEMIVEKGSFKAAATALHKTQPTLSISIKKLEAEFDLLLFSREEYRPKLTEEGKVFYNWAKQCLRTFRELETVGKELGLHKVEPTLQIVIDPLVRFEAIEGIFEECLNPSRPTVLSLRSEILGQGMELLLDKQVDFAIAPMLSPKRDIESLAFDRVELLPCIANTLALGQSNLDLGWLETQTQIIARSFHKGDRLAEDMSFGVLEKGKKCFVSDHSMKRNLILQGFGWGRLAAHEWAAERADGRLVLLSCEGLEPVSIEMHLMRNRLKPMGPVAKAIWQRLRDSSMAKRNLASRPSN